MAGGIRKLRGRTRADRATANTLGDMAVFFFLPILQIRAIGAEGAAILILPFGAIVLMHLLSEAIWERPTYRGVRLLLRSGREGEAADCRRKMSRFGALTGLVIALVLPMIAPLLFGDEASRMGTGWIMLAVLPALVFAGAIGPRKGFLRAQGAGAELVLTVLLQTLLLIFMPCVFGVILGRYGARVDALLLTDQYAAVYGAIGAMAGMSLAFFCAWLIVFVAGLKFRVPNLALGSGRPRGGYAYFSTDGVLFLAGFAVCIFDLWRFFHAALSEKEAALVTDGTVLSGAALFGRFGATVFAPFVMIGCILSIPFILSVYQIHARFQREDDASAIDRYAGMIRHAMILFLPVTFLLSALATPVQTIINGKPDEMMEGLFRIQILAVPLLAFGILLALLFVKCGSVRAVLLAGAAGIAVHVIAVFLFTAGGRGIYAYVFAHLLGFLVFVSVTGVLLAAAFSYRQEWVHGLIIPFLSAAVSALPGFALASVLSGVIGEILTVVLVTAVGLLLYMVLLTVFHGITEYELYHIPGGKLFVGLSRLFGR
ncbi:MAG: oligosaccharide flippase family protein [Lachnospiraceae bacterium]|nr:oligosaccharide flippase family protein [Lachnospiraceae bacterium]